MKVSLTTEDELKNHVENYGFKFISFDGKEKVVVECKNGHIKEYGIYYIKKANCNECIKIEFSQSIRKEIEDMGYQLLNEYENSSTKLHTICPNGHKRICNLQSIRNDECKKCFNERKLKELIHKIESNGFKIITPPKDTRDYVTVVCENGHIKTCKAWNLLIHSCVECEYGRPLQYDIEFCKEKFSDRGFTLLSTEYINCKTPMEYICVCGNKSTTTLDKVLNGDKHFCDNCKHEHNKGESHWAWNGGETPEHVRIRGTSVYRQWRNSVLERDNNTCLCCENTIGEMHVHHIDSYSSNENTRFDIYNGITLCKECHDMFLEGSFHYTYGMHNNNIFQLQEYFDDIRSSLNLPLFNIEKKIFRITNTYLKRLLVDKNS